MTPGAALVSTVLHDVLHAAAGAPTPPPAPAPGTILPGLPPGISVPPERTGQIVAAAFAILLDVAGLTAVGIGTFVSRYRRHTRSNGRIRLDG